MGLGKDAELSGSWWVPEYSQGGHGQKSGSPEMDGEDISLQIKV